MTARRRNGSSGAWATKTHHGPLWKYVHPAKYLRSEYRKAKRAMRPMKVIGRVSSLDQVANLGRTTVTKVNAQTRQADLQRATKAAAKKSPAKKKSAAKRADPYAIAAAIPGQNRTLAAKQAAAVKRASAPTKQVAKRKSDGSGQFDGSKSMLDRDRATWQSALGGQVDPRLLPRSARSRKQRPAGY